jgi:MFS family permease
MTMSTELPEPGAHPGILDEPTSTIGVIRSRTGTKRLGLGFMVIGLAWVFANSVANSLPLQAKIAILAPDDKVFILALFTAVGGLLTTVALFFWGAVSDLTRSRLGKRTPWIIVGAISGAIGLVLIGISDNVGGLMAAFIGYQLLFSALPSAVLAIFPDRIPRDKRGTASAIYGGAQVLGGAIANIIASQFLSAPTMMFFIASAVILIGGLAFVAIAPDFSSKDEPRVTLDLSGLAESFKFPAKAPDFYWAFAGRFLLLFGLYMVQNFSLYILTDYIGLTNDEAAPVVALSGFSSLITIVLGISFAGPISDKIKRRRMPIFIASLLFGVAVLLPLVWPTSTSMIIFAAVSGLGLGAFLAVDTALMTEVLPSDESRGKDLGILNTANTVPGIIAPLATAGIVGLGFGYPPVFVIALVVIIIGAFSIFKIKSVR